MILRLVEQIPYYCTVCKSAVDILRYTALRACCPVSIGMESGLLAALAGTLRVHLHTCGVAHAAVYRQGMIIHLAEYGSYAHGILLRRRTTVDSGVQLPTLQYVSPAERPAAHKLLLRHPQQPPYRFLATL